MSTRWSAAFVAVFLLLTQAAGAEDKYLQQARALVKKYPLVDTHIDVPFRLQKHWEDVTGVTTSGDFDYPRARSGGLDVPFMSIYIPVKKEAEGGSKALADVLIDQVEALVARAPQKFSLVTDVDSIRNAFARGKIGLALGMENGAAIEGDLANLQHFYDRGIRYITLAHAKANHIADSSYDENRLWGGLSPFGRELVVAMNRMGVMVDISHVSDDAFYEVLELSSAPVIASHSSLRHFTPGFERNMSDKMVKALAKRGGLVMVNFGSAFVTEKANAYSLRWKGAKTAYIEQIGGDASDLRVEVFAENYKRRFPYPYATVADVADHFDRVVKLVGIDHVGIGSDYDGVGDSLPKGLKDVSSYPNLIAELLRRGYREEAIGKLLGGNLLRVMAEVEAYAAGH